MTRVISASRRHLLVHCRATSTTASATLATTIRRQRSALALPVAPAPAPAPLLVRKIQRPLMWCRCCISNRATWTIRRMPLTTVWINSSRSFTWSTSHRSQLSIRWVSLLSVQIHDYICIKCFFAIIHNAHVCTHLKNERASERAPAARSDTILLYNIYIGIFTMYYICVRAALACCSSIWCLSIPKPMPNGTCSLSALLILSFCFSHEPAADALVWKTHRQIYSNTPRVLRYIYNLWGLIFGASMQQLVHTLLCKAM